MNDSTADVATMATGPLRAAVRAIEPHTEADPVGVLAALLSMTSCALSKPRLVIGGKKHPLGVWTLLVGETGKGRKGTALAAAKAVMDGAYPDFVDLHEATGITSGAGVIKFLAERQEGAFEAKDDAEAAGEAYDGLQPGDLRALFLEEEYVNVMNRAKRDGSLSGVLRKAWDGVTLASMTAKNGARIAGAHVVIHGHTVPREFRTAISGTDISGGTYNRLLTVHVQRSQRLRFGYVMPPNALRAAQDALRDGIAAARKVKEVAFTDAALGLLNGRLGDEIEEWDEGDETVRSFASRALDQVTRIAAIYALVDRRRSVGADDVTAAWHFVRYALESVRFLMGAGNSDGLEARIRTYVVQAGAAGIKSGELYRKLGRLADAAAIGAAIESMPEITRERRTGAGRPAVIYRWSLAAPERATDTNEPEAVPEPAQLPTRRPTASRPARRPTDTAISAPQATGPGPVASVARPSRTRASANRTAAAAGNTRRITVALPATPATSRRQTPRELPDLI